MVSISATTESPPDIGDCIGVAELMRIVPRDLIDRALSSTNREQRRERVFSDHLVVYFVILMGMFLDLPYLFVLEKLASTLDWLQVGTGKLANLSEPAIVQARQRIGLEPLKELFGLFAQPLSTNKTLGAFFHDRRILVIDGSTFILSDSKKNAEAFGRPSNQSGPAGQPQIRCVAVIEYATRLFVDLTLGPYKGTSEQSLAPTLLSRMQPGSLCLGDRLYASYENCKTLMDRGVDFVWRVKKDLNLTPIRHFADGSYEAKIHLYINRKKQKQSLLVRVIKYKIDDQADEVRLITSIFDESILAIEFAQLYPARWSEETTLSEIKSVLRHRNLLLRSQSPDMVKQELYGLFIAHSVVRRFMFHASNQVGIPPDQLSFRRSIYVLRENLPKFGSSRNFSPGTVGEEDPEPSSKQKISRAKETGS